MEESQQESFNKRRLDFNSQVFLTSSTEFDEEIGAYSEHQVDKKSVDEYVDSEMERLTERINCFILYFVCLLIL
jgi:hypothetical protein